MNADGSAVILDNEGMMQTWQESRVDNVDENNPLVINIYLPKNTWSVNESILSFKLLPFRSYSKGLSSSGENIISTTSSGGGASTTTSGDSGIDVRYGDSITEEADGHRHMFKMVIGHKHKIDIPNHTHDFSVNIPPHSHDIQHGIFTSTTATGVGVIINGVDRTSYLGGKFRTDKVDLDITDFLNVASWNEIKLTSERLGRIDASVFIQAFMGM